MNTVDLTKLKDGEIVHFKGGGSEIVSHVALFNGQFHIDFDGFCSHIFSKEGELYVSDGYYPDSLFNIVRISRAVDLPFDRVPPVAPDEECEKHMKAGMNQGMYGGKDNREAQRALNMMYSDLVEQAIANKPLASCRKESNRVMTKADLDKLSLRVHIYCAAIFAFILYMHIFKL